MNSEIFLIAALSADGKIAKTPDHRTFDWTSKQDQDFFVRKTKEAGVVVMGRKTFETIGKPLDDRLNVVMTKDAQDREQIQGVLEWTSDDPETIVDRFKETYKKIAIIGGQEVYSAFLRAGLVTDIYLTIEPVLFGEGISFVSELDPVDLELVSSERLGEHAMRLHYRVGDRV